MKLSQFFLKTHRDAPTDASLPSQQLMHRAGMIHKVAQGLYGWLPLGQRVLKKIETIIDDEMARSGAQRVDFPIIQPADIWYKSGRLKPDDSSYGPEMLKIVDRNQGELVVSPTGEELFTSIIAGMNMSYKDMPLNLYQIEKKYRDEERPRFGTLRTREFTMKDGYSFDTSEAASHVTYHRMFAAYQRIFHRMGVSAIPLEAPRGPVGGSLSHEFVIPTENGESDILFDARLLDPSQVPPESIYQSDTTLAQHFGAIGSLRGITADMLPEGQPAPEGLIAKRGIEVGHIFNLGTRYSQPLQAQFTDKTGKKEFAHMGCYGIGVSRLPAAIIETSHDKDGIIWSPSIAPFQVVLVNAAVKDETTTAIASQLYEMLQEKGVEVLFDDRDINTGIKLKDADLIGVPLQIRIGKREAAGNEVQIKVRSTGETFTVPVGDAVYALGQKLQPVPAL